MYVEVNDREKDMVVAHGRVRWRKLFINSDPVWRGIIMLQRKTEEKKKGRIR